MTKPADEGDAGMRHLVPLDDEAVERLLAGRRLTAPGDLADLAPLLDDIRSLGHGPVPPPSSALTRILTMGAPEDAGPMYPAGSTQDDTARRRAATKASWVAAAAATVVAVAATLDVLPRPAQRMVATAVSAVTPFELPRDAQHQNSAEKSPAAEAGRAPRAAKTPSDGARSGVRQPPTTRQAGRGSTGGVLPPVGEAPEANGTQTQPRRPVPPTSAPATSPAVSASPGNSLPGTRAPVTAAPVVTSPPSPAQPPGGASRPDRRSATLTGALVVPGPGDPDGTGAASIELNAEKGQLCLTLTLSAVAPPTGLHLHQGPQGQSGPVVLELPPPTEVGPPASVCVPVPSDLSRRLREEPAGYYLEVHTREFADGALRGQLSTEPPTS